MSSVARTISIVHQFVSNLVESAYIDKGCLMATINEVAEYAKVSVKTVSRVLNDYEHISAKTRKKVEDAMKALNYAPSSIARQMRTGDSLSIGMLYGDPSSGYQARLNHAVLKACSDARRYLAVEFFDESSSRWRQQVEAFLDRTQVQNMILVPPMCDASDLHALLKERNIKFVLISPSSPLSGASSIYIDDRAAAMEITQHLLDLGHRRIGHISGDTGHVATLLRLQGYQAAIERYADAEVDHSIILSGRFKFKDALECAHKMLESKNRPTAIFAANDEMAAAVIMVASRLGLDVPGDLSVVGFDNTHISEIIWPALTTIAQPFEQIGIEAVRLVSGGANTDSSESLTKVLPHTLLVRDSTGPAPIRS